MLSLPEENMDTIGKYRRMKKKADPVIEFKPYLEEAYLYRGIAQNENRVTGAGPASRSGK